MDNNRPNFLSHKELTEMGEDQVKRRRLRSPWGPLTVLVVIVVAVFLIFHHPSRPDYSILQNVPKAQASAIKKVIQTEAINNLELPTLLPYTVTAAHCPTPAIDPVRHHTITIYLANTVDGRVLEIQASSTSSNSQIKQNDVSMLNEKITKLADGTVALYGNNGAGSQLAWNRDGVRYVITSSNKQNASDMTEQQLIQAANSFQ